MTTILLRMGRWRLLLCNEFPKTEVFGPPPNTKQKPLRRNLNHAGRGRPRKPHSHSFTPFGNSKVIKWKWRSEGVTEWMKWMNDSLGNSWGTQSFWLPQISPAVGGSRDVRTRKWSGVNGMESILWPHRHGSEKKRSIATSVSPDSVFMFTWELGWKQLLRRFLWRILWNTVKWLYMTSPITDTMNSTRQQTKRGALYRSW